MSEVAMVSLSWHFLAVCGRMLLRVRGAVRCLGVYMTSSTTPRPARERPTLLDASPRVAGRARSPRQLCRPARGPLSSCSLFRSSRITLTALHHGVVVHFKSRSCPACPQTQWRRHGTRRGDAGTARAANGAFSGTRRAFGSPGAWSFTPHSTHWRAYWVSTSRTCGRGQHLIRVGSSRSNARQRTHAASRVCALITKGHANLHPLNVGGRALPWARMARRAACASQCLAVVGLQGADLRWLDSEGILLIERSGWVERVPDIPRRCTSIQRREYATRSVLKSRRTCCTTLLGVQVVVFHLV